MHASGLNRERNWKLEAENWKLFDHLAHRTRPQALFVTIKGLH